MTCTANYANKYVATIDSCEACNILCNFFISGLHESTIGRYSKAESHLAGMSNCNLDYLTKQIFWKYKIKVNSKQTQTFYSLRRRNHRLQRVAL